MIRRGGNTGYFGIQPGEAALPRAVPAALVKRRKGIYIRIWRGESRRAHLCGRPHPHPAGYLETIESVMEMKHYTAAFLLVALLAACGRATAQYTEPNADEKKAVIYAAGCLWEGKLLRKNVLYHRASVTQRSVTLSMTDISVVDALRYICMGTGMQFRLEVEGVVVEDRTTALWALALQVFTVKPTFSEIVGDANTEAALKEQLESYGVDFPLGARIKYDRDRGLLFVRHTPPRLKDVEKVLQLLGVFEAKAFDRAPPQRPVMPLEKAPYREKLALVIPELEFEDVLLGAAVLAIAEKAREVDPERKGINVLIHDKRYDDPVVLGESEWDISLQELRPELDWEATKP